jgi:uncharacterized membrane protein YheB (UPF0754 family)
LELQDILWQLLASMAAGGLVGYVTNYLAVRMLFRPRKPVRIPLLGIRLQGLIPAKKAELVESLASVAADYFKGVGLSREVERSIREVVRDNVRRALQGWLERNRTLSMLLAPYIDTIASLVADQLAAPLAQRLAREAAGRVDVARIVREEAERLSDEEIEEMFWRIAGKELRYIELQGLILGAAIGPIELLLLKLIG